MTGFHQSKNERYRVVDLVTAIILNIGFRVCKWTGVPEKRVQSFAFYMGDAQPKHAEKGSSKGETPHASSSHGIRGTGGKWRGENPYVSLCALMFLYIYISTIDIVDSTLSMHSVRLRFESRSSQNKKVARNDCSFYDSKIFRDRSKYVLTLLQYKHFCLKKTKQFSAKKG